MTSRLPEIEFHRLFNGRLCLYQKKKGYRFSVDSVLLGAFAGQKVCGVVADLGTGSGVLPVILSKSGKVKQIFGIEIQKDLVAVAEKNVLYNRCSEKAKITCADIKNIRDCFSAETFDAVLTNPPFYRIGSGRMNPEAENAIARHELKGTVSDFVRGAAFLLKQKGSFYAVYTPARITDLICEMRKYRIEPKALQFVYPNGKDPANMVLVEGIKGAGVETKIIPPVVLFGENRKYTKQANSIFNTL